MSAPPSTVLVSAGVGTHLWRALRWVTTPLVPDDYLGLIDPLWSARELCGRLEAVWPEACDAATLVIRPGRGWRRHRAGQYVRISVDLDGVRHCRTFSLSSAPERPDERIAITVKAVRGGRVSPYLVHRISPGAVLGLSPPQGEFVLPSTLPPRLLFLTAGSGITPVMAMLRSLAMRDQMPDVVLVHSAPTPQDALFHGELRALAAQFTSLRLHEWFTRVRPGAGGLPGRLSMADLSELCPDWSHRQVWACGPPGMLDAIEAHWRTGADPARLHLERFQVPIASGKTAGGRVRFLRSGRQARAEGDTPLLVVGERAGVLMPSGCRMGICFSCVVPLRSGRVRDLRDGRERDEAGELVQTCVSVAAGPVDIDI